ncbi:SGNH/GDSL hydrolase family protein [Pseudomonas ovata]|uniref:SGNH/GDSL hydrolase family protein n=1 Tax=Pseudomonas ovata TaxID=1839709 RepID=UPI000D68F5D9|nr:SGNH/GDSL hydrolase family protein [Pseudomonas ovata]
MAYNTGNPLGSSSPKDLSDNAHNLDIAMNGPALSFTDRFGVSRYSIVKLNTLIATAVAEVDPIVTAAKSSVNSTRDAANAEMLQTAADLGDDLNNKRYPTYAAMIADPQVRDAVVAVVDDDPDSTKNGWYYWSLATSEWLRFEDQPASTSALTSAVPQVEVLPRFVPIAVDEDEKVPVWLADGALEALGFGPGLSKDVAYIAGTESVPTASKLVPVFTDENRNVPIWLEDGLLAALGLSPSLIATLGLDRGFAPLNQPSASQRPASTDGRSLYSWRSKVAKIKKAVTGQVRLLLTGDSWTEYVAIPQQLATLLYGDLGKAGEGWISVNGTYMLNGLTLAKTGWTLYDASTGAVPAYGTGVDGMYITATTTTATLAIGSAKATNFDIYYRKHGGTFRWRVDGGAWTAVVADTSGGLGKVSITGLADAVHSLELDTTGNAGTVVICGFRASTPAAVGIELLKAGNAGLDGEQLARFTSNISPIAVDFAPDVVVVILSTNDYRRTSSTVEKYIAALVELVSQYRIASPDAAFIFIAPADSNGVAIRPLTDYRNALYTFCIASGHEFYNMNEEWASYAKMNALGMWVDDLHLNDNGAYALASRLSSKFLK